MRYEELVVKVSASSGLDVETVKAVLFSFPDGLVGLPEGDSVRTPLGVFRMTKRAARIVTPPGKDEKVAVDAEMVVKLHAGTRLRRNT